jgi:hypothetical protein
MKMNKGIGMVKYGYSLPTVQTMNISLNTQDFHTKTIHENERDYIISVLKNATAKYEVQEEQPKY